MLDFGNPRRQALHGVVVADVNDGLEDDGPAVGALVDEVHRAARNLHAASQDRLVHVRAIHANTAEGGQQRGMDVHDPSAKLFDERRRENPEEARQTHQADVMRLEDLD